MQRGRLYRKDHFRARFNAMSSAKLRYIVRWDSIREARMMAYGILQNRKS
jgi:hypothetical protein